VLVDVIVGVDIKIANNKSYNTHKPWCSPLFLKYFLGRHSNEVEQALRIKRDE